jgi:MFS family permease
VFGGFVALALWLPKYYVGEYGLPLATAAFLTIFFDLPSGAIRALGGWASDKWGGNVVTWWVLWISLACLFLLSYPPTTMVIHGIKGDVSVNLGIGVVLFTVLAFVVGMAQGFGKASVYRSLADHYPTQMGVVGGIVGLIGGLGGFVMPIMFGVAADAVGVRSSCFMLMFLLVVVTMLWTWVAEKNEREEILERHADARAELAGANLIERVYRRRHLLADWRPDDETFWQSVGRRIANRNLWLSMPALLLAFAVWVVWSVIVVELPASASSSPKISCSGWRRCPACPGPFFRAAVFLRGADLRRAQLDGVQHRAVVAADAVDRRRGARSQYQLRRVRRHRPAVRAGRGQFLLQHGQYQLLLPAAAARHRAGPERRRRQSGRRAGATHRADQYLRWGAVDSRRQCANPCRWGQRHHADLAAKRRLYLGAVHRRSLRSPPGLAWTTSARSRPVSPSRWRSSATSISG